MKRYDKIQSLLKKSHDTARPALRVKSWKAVSFQNPPSMSLPLPLSSAVYPWILTQRTRLSLHSIGGTHVSVHEVLKKFQAKKWFIKKSLLSGKCIDFCKI